MELLLVLAIIALMVAAAAPRLTEFTNGRKSDDLARTIVSLARYARTEAVSEGRDYRLNVDPSSRQVWLTVADDTGQYVAPPGDYGQHYPLPDGARLDTDIPAKPDGGQYVTFNSNGRAEEAQIHITNSAGKTVTVVCSSPTELFRIAQPGEVLP